MKIEIMAMVALPMLGETTCGLTHRHSHGTCEE